jgi:hypothetical protein
MERKKSFWTSLRGILTVITSLLVAITGLISVLYHVDLYGTKAPLGVQPSKELKEPVSLKSSTAQGGQPLVQVVPQQPTAALNTTPSPSAHNEDLDNFQKLNALVISLKFFAYEEAIPPAEKQNYSDSFARSQTRNIGWRLYLAYPETSEAVKFSIESICYGPKGNIIDGRFDKVGVNAGWKRNGFSFKGVKVSDNWEPGKYRVVLKIGGKEVANDSFKIVADK